MSLPTSNTKDVFRHATGKTVVGVYTEDGHEFAGDVVVLVLSDGTGLAFGTGNGSHWVVSPDDVTRRVRQRRQDLERAADDLRDALKAEAAL